METLLNQSDENAWQQLAPMLDDAVARLGAAERNAVVLRFFDGRSMREVGAGLGISEDSAAKRISRAVQKLRAFFAKRGVVLSTTAICGAISTNSVLSAPAQVSSSVVAKAVGSSALPASTSALVKGVMDTLAWLKIKIALTVAGISLVAVGGVTATLALEKRHPAAARILERTQQTYSGLSSYSDTWKSVTFLGGTQLFDGLIHSNRTMLARPLLYRIESIADAKPIASTAIWSAGDGDFWEMTVGGPRNDRLVYHRSYNVVSNFSPDFHVPFFSAPIPCAFFDKQDWDSLPALARAKDLARLADESIGTNECYTVSATTKAPIFNITLWIGKSDFLIHRLRFVWVEPDAFGRRVVDAAGNPRRFNYTVIKTHENIVVNKTMAAKEFLRPLPARFATVSEREMRADDPRYLDLDTGEFVQVHPPGDLFWSNTESDLQARAGVNMVALAVTEAKWSASAMEILERLSKEMLQKQVRIGGSESKLEPGPKRTWFFKTSEGSAGVLQILPKNEVILIQDRAGELQTLPRNDRPGSVLIRWRLVQTPSEGR